MAYLNDLLGEGESVMFEAHQHWFILFTRVLIEIILLILIIAATTILMAAQPDIAQIVLFVGIGLSVLVLLSAFIDYLRWSRHQYVVTDRQVIQVRGIFNKTVFNSSLEKINDVVLHQSVFGRMFNYGDIDILTANEEGIDRMRRITDPVGFKRAMLDARARYDGLLPRNAPAQAAAPPTAEALLTQLAALHASGVLNDAEWEAKKREVLSRI